MDAKRGTHLVRDILEAHSRGVEGGGLLGVANPEPDVVKAVENADLRLYTDQSTGVTRPRSVHLRAQWVFHSLPFVRLFLIRAKSNYFMLLGGARCKSFG